MGKTKPSKKASVLTAKPAAAAAAVADIDDIFAAPKAKVSKASSGDKKKQAGSSGGAVVEAAAKKEKKDKKDKKKDKSDKKDNNKAAEPAAASTVVEVVDPSQAIANAVLAAKVEKEKRDRREVEADMAFRDSRGDGDRKRTEEGFLVFKEAELGIDPEQGGTPLCPFDCECCF